MSHVIPKVSILFSLNLCVLLILFRNHNHLINLSNCRNVLRELCFEILIDANLTLHVQNWPQRGSYSIWSVWPLTMPLFLAGWEWRHVGKHVQIMGKKAFKQSLVCFLHGWTYFLCITAKSSDFESRHDLCFGTSSETLWWSFDDDATLQRCTHGNKMWLTSSMTHDLSVCRSVAIEQQRWWVE